MFITNGLADELLFQIQFVATVWVSFISASAHKNLILKVGVDMLTFTKPCVEMLAILWRP